jgi:hypothetical protein
VLIGIPFHLHFYQSAHKAWCLSSSPDSCHSFSRQRYTADKYYFHCCWLGTNDSSGL